MLPFLVYSQDKIIDSLLLLLQNAQYDSTRINLNFMLSKQLTGYDIVRADHHLEAGYQLAKIKNDTYYTAYYFQNKGGLLFDMAKYDAAGKHFDSAIALYNTLINSSKQDAKRQETYKFAKTDCLTGKGLLAAKLYHYQESIQYYLQAIAGIENMEGKGDRKSVV